MSQSDSTTCSSRVRTLHPFTMEGSPLMEFSQIESPKVMTDSGTLMCTSIGRSPVLSRSLRCSHPKQRYSYKERGRSNSNHLTKAAEAAIATSTEFSDDRSLGSSEDLATNNLAKSTVTDQLTSNYTSNEKTGTNSNLGSDELEETASVEATPEAEVEDSVENANSDSSSTEAEAMGARSTETGSDTVFTNIAYTTGAGVSSLLRTTNLAKGDLANLIEKAILDFCSSRTVETMRRMFAGVTNETDPAQLRVGGRHEDRMAAAQHPVTGELVKEGIVIGDVDAFGPRVHREFILPLRDSLISTILKEPGVFRSICYRSHCQIEVTRRLLNRKLCVGGRWRKYMILRISGPTYKLIANCDSLLRKALPSYKLRQDYKTPAICRMFLREDVPDNADLYYNYQRTGGTTQRYGWLKLESKFRQMHLRTQAHCPWKEGLLKAGKLAFSNKGVQMCMAHVYPSMGYQTSTPLEHDYKGAYAMEPAHVLHDQYYLRRQAELNLKRQLTIPVCR